MLDNLVYDKDALIEVTKEFTFDSCHGLLAYEGKLNMNMKGEVKYE